MSHSDSYLSGVISDTVISITSSAFLNCTRVGDVRKVRISSTSQSHTLSKLNPITLRNSIRIRYAYSSFNQAKKFLFISKLPFTTRSILVKVFVALNSQSVQGKIYAPELLEVHVPDLYSTALRPSVVIDVCKLLNDPSKAHTTLFVLILFGSSCPQHVTLGLADIV